MPHCKEIDLYPLGWENDPDEERFPLNTLDYLSTSTWTNFALFFQLSPEAQKYQIEIILTHGLERTLSQVRQYAGIIERDPDGHHSIVKRRTSTFKLIIQHIDSPSDSFPSFHDLEKAHFTTASLGDASILSNDFMAFADREGAHPNNKPAMASFKANFIPGGLIFNLQLHHYANGLKGWTEFMKQMAENFYAIAKVCFYPSHLFCALMWRVFCRVREPFYRPGLDYLPLFGQGVSVGKQFSGDTELPAALQGNMQFDITSATSPLPQPTLADVLYQKPLHELASYIRHLSESVTTELLSSRLGAVAHLRDKQDLSIRVDDFPAMAQYVTDWRTAELCTFDFGFGKPAAFRHLFDRVPQGHAIVYPTRRGVPGREADEGWEVQVSFERELVGKLVGDEEWVKYLEFRGVDMHGDAEKGDKAKL